MRPEDVRLLNETVIAFVVAVGILWAYCAFRILK